LDKIRRIAAFPPAAAERNATMSEEHHGAISEADFIALGELLDARRRARRSLVWGVLIIAVAGVVSLATYADAQQQAAQTGEGSYYVLWGAMLFGGLKVFRAGRVLWAVSRALRPLRQSRHGGDR
jgi:hypothetical protein